MAAMGCHATRALEIALVEGANPEELQYGQACTLIVALTCILVVRAFVLLG
jgi:hypothetical protein